MAQSAGRAEIGLQHQYIVPGWHLNHNIQL